VKREEEDTQKPTEVHWKRFKFMPVWETHRLHLGFRLLQKGHKGDGVRAPFERRQTKEALRAQR
jgi:hypothetical protein